MSTDHLQQTKRMRPGVKALIVHNGKILMIRELVLRDGNQIKITDFPGGGIEFGEDLEDALVREVKEETCLDIKVGRAVGAWGFVLGEKDHADPEKHGVHIVCIGYQCSLVGEANIDMSKNPAAEDIFDAKWYSREELLLDKDIFFGNKGMAEAVENLEI